ncbi:hypothetical protein OROHE_016421 [Orobanche hederae]
MSTDLYGHVDSDWMEVGRREDDEAFHEALGDDDDEFYVGSPSPERDEGLPEEVIEAFLETAAVGEGGDEVCAVCLDDLYGGDRAVAVASEHG